MALLGRDTLVTGPLPDGTLLLETFHGKETLGRPYHYSLTLLSDDGNIAADQVLGQPLTVQIKLDSGYMRNFNGIVTYFAKTGMAMHHTRYAAVLNPKLTLFEYTRDCRTFFDQKTPELASEVLSQRGYSDVDSGSLKGDYRQREFCVQYRESDYHFLQRLFEEDGIYYFFRHEKDKHTMVLADATTAHAKAPGYESVLCLPKQRKQAREEEHFWSVRVSGALYPGKFSVLQSYDHGKVRPRGAQLQNKTSTDGQPGGGFEDYDNPGFSSEKSYVEADAAVRLESLYAANTLVEVEGNTMGLGVGDLVTLRKSLSDLEFNPFWSQADFKKEFLITSASYTISINQYETGDAADSDEPFKATFTLFDSQLQFRMPRTTPKPRIEGPQTAVVVGPSGDEIYTDKLGRVKVQFDWDRLGEFDQKSSIWVRVAQVWAGKQWGAIHIPRIGHEVIVEFLDGDPDRPIITGRVYNTDNMPPYSLPDKKTISGIKSRSSKGGSSSNFNELSFDDEKGSELVYLQAELNMKTLVKNDESHTVGHDRIKHVVNDETTNVDANRTEEVGKDETITIHGNRTEEVDKNEDITIHGARTEEVDKNEDVTITGSRTHKVRTNETVDITGQRKETVGQSENVSIGGTRTVVVTKADSLKVKDERKQDIAKDDQLKVGKKLLIDAGDEIMLKSGQASITLKKDGTIILKGKDIALTASGKINAKASGNVIIKGAKIGQN